jgi:tetratricopeptide (TPR) repeat protein
MAKGERGERHPSAAELEHFLLGEMAPRQAAPVLSHLLSGCTRCRQAMAPLASVMLGSGAVSVEEAAPTSGAEYDFPLFKAFAAAREYAASIGKENLAARHTGQAFPKEVPVADALAAQAQARDARERCEALLERCLSLRHGDPEGLIMTASLAVAFAEKMATDATDGSTPEELAELQARAWAELGNAHRVADDFPAAEVALARALELHNLGTGDPLLLARLMDLTASLYTDQRRFAEAHRLLDCVYAIYSRMDDRQSAARALISKGISTGYAFESEEAIRLLAQGIQQVDAVRDPKLMLAAVHGLLWCLLDAGRVAEVDRLLVQVRDLYAVHGEHFDEVRAQWLEGRVAAGQGREEEAEQVLLHVRDAFMQDKQPYDAALASLDLATVWLQQGRTTEIRLLVDEMVEIFRARNVRREALGALLMLHEAVQKDQATAALLQRVAVEFRRLERFPGRRSPISG